MTTPPMPAGKRRLVFWLVMAQSAAILGTCAGAVVDSTPLAVFCAASVVGIAAYCGWARFATSWGKGL